ncbi:amino acid ABC transporter permease [Phyllobacterium ifriqiyense]|uniref:amino acid ABC transporter permease n=1 Tax=Phyllobacterium ifriqiyense TaxID=314238 RepID=UPI00339963F9
MDLSIMVPELLKALPLTLAITFTAMIVGFCLALIATTFRVRRIPVISQLADLYVSYARSVPVVLQLFVAFYGLPLVVALFEVEDFVSPNVAAIVGLSLYHGGYLSEVLRPAYLAIDRGQHDAADSLGYTFLKKLLRVVGPQAIHIALPGYGNAIIYLIHNVALVMYIGAADVMATAHLVMERDYNQYQFETYLVLAVIYSLLCLVAWLIVRFFEARNAKFTSNTTPTAATLMPSV